MLTHSGIALVIALAITLIIPELVTSAQSVYPMLKNEWQFFRLWYIISHCECTGRKPGEMVRSYTAISTGFKIVEHLLICLFFYSRN